MTKKDIRNFIDRRMLGNLETAIRMVDEEYPASMVRDQMHQAFEDLLFASGLGVINNHEEFDNINHALCFTSIYDYALTGR